MQRHKPPRVKSLPSIAPVDAHERLRDYLTETEFLVLLQGTQRSRYHWRNAAMLMLTFYHGLRVSELCNLRRQDVDLHHGRIWIARLKGSLFSGGRSGTFRWTDAGGVSSTPGIRRCDLRQSD